jgi:selenocysteine lyase/cysteine desulfurase
MGKYRIEVPLILLNGRKLIRVSVQGCNTRREVEKLVEVLREMIEFWKKIIQKDEK